ncbi:MAG: hypothetical protein HLUCCA05_13090 [Roseibaca calidilacus]|uniref:Adenylosuccinate lyase n=1 Tax=Roseibaca calidilacus TaxID=1666912 RepID=A0A0N8K8D7_9RHOB|nr:hypothetical protein [Roseibaca calidilacus]KPP94249.1 MAG: hypothetical protein HLUCCA05_13090 [Roseibaca calidilacus]CUX81305.1 hypothetical protein Ga0058931_1681 [Roseibaca calidilacus]
MKLKMTLAAFILGALPGMALAGGCGWHKDVTANACAEGQVYDSDSGSCITPTTS